MPREHAVSRGELCAHTRPLVVLRPEKHALGHAYADCNLVHEMLHEAGECRGRSRRHDLDSVGRPHVTNHSHLRHLVLLRLSVRHGYGRRRREQIAWIRRAAVVEHKRRLLRREAHARLLGFENLVKHPRRFDCCVEVGYAAVLIDAERVKVMAKVMRLHVLRSEVNAFPRDSINAIRDRLAKFVGDNPLIVVVGLSAESVRISDARPRDQLNLQLVTDAANRKAAVAVNGALFASELHELLERVPASHVAPLAPLMKKLRDRLIVGAVLRRRRVFVRRKVVPEFARDLARFWEILHEVARFPHHHDTRARGLRRFARLSVGLRRIKPVRLRRVVAEKRGLDARLQTLFAPRRRHGFNRFVNPRALCNDFRRVEGFHGCQC